MAIVNMTNVGVKGEKGQFAWEYEDDVSSVTEGDTIIIPGGVVGIAVTLDIGAACTAKVQTTTDKIQDVINEKATVTWVDWDAGAVIADTQDYCKPVTAIRLVQTIGTNKTKMKLRAQ